MNAPIPARTSATAPEHAPCRRPRAMSSCGSGVSKSTVSRICAGIDAEIAEFRNRPLGHIAMRYVYLDATYVKARVAHRIVSRAVVVATAVTMDGNREVLGLDGVWKRRPDCVAVALGGSRVDVAGEVGDLDEVVELVADERHERVA